MSLQDLVASTWGSQRYMPMTGVGTKPANAAVNTCSVLALMRELIGLSSQVCGLQHWIQVPSPLFPEGSPCLQACLQNSCLPSPGSLLAAQRHPPPYTPAF